MRRLVSMATVLGVMVAACSDDGAAGATEGESTTSTTDDTITTLPLTSAVPGDDDDDDGEVTSEPDPTSNGDSLDTTGPSDSSGTDTTTTGGDESESTGDVVPVTIDWCRLQSPASVDIAAGESFTAYGRYYIETVTDQSTLNDPHPLVVAELGYGADGSDPAGDPWTWTPGTPNPGWDGNDWGEPNNDETMGEITIDRAGTYDYAMRLSGDGGTTWVYCDLDDLLNGGYTPDQAGDATVG
jgi:hypothetical protein